MPILSKYSKMASANLWGLGAEESEQKASLPCMSGTRERFITDPFLDSMKDDEQETASNRDMKGIISNLEMRRSKAIEEYRKTGFRRVIGTTSWLNMSDLQVDTVDTAGKEDKTFKVIE